jgi:hypothetical protein
MAQKNVSGGPSVMDESGVYDFDALIAEATRRDDAGNFVHYGSGGPKPTMVLFPYIHVIENIQAPATGRAAADSGARAALLMQNLKPKTTLPYQPAVYGAKYGSDDDDEADTGRASEAAPKSVYTPAFGKVPPTDASGRDRPNLASARGTAIATQQNAAAMTDLVVDMNARKVIEAARKEKIGVFPLRKLLTEVLHCILPVCDLCLLL